MNYLVSHKNIDAYLHCPLLHTKFNYKEDISDVSSLFEQIVKYILMRKMVYNTWTTHRQAKDVWVKTLNNLLKDKYDLKVMNSMILLINDLIIKIPEAFQDYSIIGIDVPVHEIFDPYIYSETIDAILSKDGEIIPLYILHETARGGRDNKIRFLNAILDNKLLEDVKEYRVITIMKSRYKEIKIDSFNIKQYAHSRSIKDLSNTISLMSMDGIPNTNNCHNCKFNHKCIL